MKKYISSLALLFGVIFNFFGQEKNNQLFIFNLDSNSSKEDIANIMKGVTYETLSASEASVTYKNVESKEANYNYITFNFDKTQKLKDAQVIIQDNTTKNKYENQLNSYEYVKQANVWKTDKGYITPGWIHNSIKYKYVFE